MITLDVNVLLDAFREDAPGHADAAPWLSTVLNGTEALAFPDETILGFMRIATNRRAFPVPAHPDLALDFCDALLAAPVAVRLHPGRRHWSIFSGLVRAQGLRANDIPDAHLAALCIEQNATLATFDRGFARFSGLRTITPSA